MLKEYKYVSCDVPHGKPCYMWLKNMVANGVTTVR